ncbi:universal stress protein [Desulfoferrobacter suflitae]|uniref:universal stress protein n=1 Tax=Desulfoferrobacter suflitae TaxID=2865782 RepID=UPI002164BAE0|nr:universal stress protein [Desulfoferrobacter suflitae]MCK8602888.1 universal stress protein [Desulfoferrobacter suflitae]
MYKRILVPLDGSPRAERIMPHVERLAQKFNSKVIFLRVVEPGSIIQRPQGAEFENKIMREEEGEAETYVSAWSGEFREKGLRSKGLVEHGAVVYAIIRVAEREDADLIAMASHGRSGLPQVFYGSVAAGILHRIDRPLLIIRSS